MLKKAEEIGDVKLYNDVSNKMEESWIWSALSNDVSDIFVERMKNLKDLTEEERPFTELTKEEFDNKIDNIVLRTERMQQRYDWAQENLYNPFQPDQYEDGSIEKEGESLDYNAWDKATKSLIFNQEAFDNILDRTNKLNANAMNIMNFKEVTYAEVSALYSKLNIRDQIALLKNEVKNFQGLELSDDSELKKLNDKKIKQLEKLEAFEKAMSIAAEGAASEAAKPEDVAKEKNNAKKAAREYLNLLTKDTRDFTNEDAFNKLIDDVFESYNLSEELETVNKNINFLLTEQGFNDQVEKNKKLAKLINENFTQILRKDLEAFENATILGDLVKDLFNQGFFMKPEDLKKLHEGDVKEMPTLYYVNAVTKDGSSKNELELNGNDYLKAASIIKDHVQALTGIVIKNSSFSKIKHSRNRNNNDKRTIADIAEQYGFKKSVVNEQEGEEKAAFEKTYRAEVPLTEVLTEVIKSKYADDREKALAEVLLNKAKEREANGEQEFVIFGKTLEQPTKFKEGTSFVNPNYSSEDFTVLRQGKKTNQKNPIEHNILKQEIARVLNSSLESNKEFKAEIERLLDIFNSKITDNKFKFFKNDPMGFIIEAMTNQSFQEILKSIDDPNPHAKNT